jgi:hypothetical protein
MATKSRMSHGKPEPPRLRISESIYCRRGGRPCRNGQNNPIWASVPAGSLEEDQIRRTGMRKTMFLRCCDYCCCDSRQAPPNKSADLPGNGSRERRQFNQHQGLWRYSSPIFTLPRTPVATGTSLSMSTGERNLLTLSVCEMSTSKIVLFSERQMEPCCSKVRKDSILSGVVYFRQVECQERPARSGFRLHTMELPAC